MHGDTPGKGNTTSPNDSVARVNGSDNKTGPSLILKVMSGDVVDIGVKSFYRPNGSAGGNSNPINDILSSLASGIVGVAGEAKGTLTQLNNTGTSPLLGALNSFITNENPNPPSGKPKAYLNWILLDEQFNYTEASSGAIPVGNADVLNTLASTGIPITKNGFLYIYVSNETQNWNVFFDNLAVQHYTGPIVEETHYYPFGLTMAGISSKAVGKIENKRKFNDGTELENKEFSDGSGLELYATTFRSYDPQIGRFHQQDPLSELYDNFTPYAFANNNPILINDPLGLAGDTVPHLPSVVVTPPNSPQPSQPGGVQPSQPGLPAGAVPLFPLPTPPPQSPPLTPVPPTPPGRVIPFTPNFPQVNPSVGVAWGARIFGVFGLILTPTPAGRGSYRAPRLFAPDPYPGHGNDKDNSNPHIVYQFTFTPTDNKTPVIKYGISDVYSNGFDRPTNQLAKFQAIYGVSVKLQILTRTVNRAHALFLEQNLVTKHVATWGVNPREQTRPGPFIF